MAVLALDHVNLRTADVPATRAFFCDMLGLRADIAPGATSIDQGCWIYDGQNRPIFHIGHIDAHYPSDGVAPFQAASGSGAVHHIALECDDYTGMSARMREAGLTVTENDIPSIGLRQLFISEANGVLIELNFRER